MFRPESNNYRQRIQSTFARRPEEPVRTEDMNVSPRFISSRRAMSPERETSFSRRARYSSPRRTQLERSRPDSVETARMDSDRMEDRARPQTVRMQERLMNMRRMDMTPSPRRMESVRTEERVRPQRVDSVRTASPRRGPGASGASAGDYDNWREIPFNPRTMSPRRLSSQTMERLRSPRTLSQETTIERLPAPVDAPTSSSPFISLSPIPSKNYDSIGGHKYGWMGGHKEYSSCGCGSSKNYDSVGGHKQYMNRCGMNSYGSVGGYTPTKKEENDFKTVTSGSHARQFMRKYPYDMNNLTEQDYINAKVYLMSK